MAASSFFHGVTVTLLDTGPRPISTPSASIIGLVDAFSPGEELAEPNKPILLTSFREAVLNFGAESSIAKSARAIFSQSAAVVIAVGVPAAAEEPGEPEEPGEEGEDINISGYMATLVTTGSDTLNVASSAARNLKVINKLKKRGLYKRKYDESMASAIIGTVTEEGDRTGMQALLDAKSVHNAQPRIIVCPGYSSLQPVAAAMGSLAEKLKAIALVDGPNTTDEEALKYFEEFGNKRIYALDPWVKVWDVEAESEVITPSSPYVAGLIVKTDREFGFWASPSNKEFLEILGTGRPIEFIDGDETCRANLLNNANITTIIRDGGYRLWGNRTLSADAKWAFITRVRTVDILMDAILFGHKWAVDRSITKTYVKDVTEGLNAFIRDLKAQGAIINFEVYPDTELNTASQLEQGKVYWNIRFTDVPPAENPNFRVEVTNQWITEVLE